MRISYPRNLKKRSGLSENRVLGEAMVRFMRNVLWPITESKTPQTGSPMVSAVPEPEPSSETVELDLP